jgi:predicted ATPase
MLGSSQYGFGTTALDPDLLSTPFGVQTNWHVITGAQSCGKTTLIDQLADKGFQTVPETGRQYFEREMARGRTIDEILESKAAVQRVLKDIQLRTEAGLRAIDLAFLDRALPDSLTFFRAFGLNPNEILSECFHHRYASVFVLDRLPIQQDGLRIEDDALAGFLDEWLAPDYGALGYTVVRVPVMSPKERLEFVLERLSEQGLI